MSEDFKMPGPFDLRLRKGYTTRTFVGDDFYGCCNTGMAPTIQHCKRNWALDGPTSFYLVGSESAIVWSEFRRQMASQEMFGSKKKLQWRRKMTIGEHTAWIYKTRASAIKKFHELSLEMAGKNKAARAKAKEQSKTFGGIVTAEVATLFQS